LKVSFDKVLILRDGFVEVEGREDVEVGTNDDTFGRENVEGSLGAPQDTPDALDVDGVGANGKRGGLSRREVREPVGGGTTKCMKIQAYEEKS